MVFAPPMDAGSLARRATRSAHVYDPGMDFIVCGDAFWISCGTWIAVWNGSAGALVGAAVAAYAIFKTIRTQRSLFQIQLSQNYTATQLADHRRNVELNKQLKAQREDVTLQLEFQAAEASKQREREAITALVATGNAFVKRFEHGREAIEELILQADSAVVRWRMELNHRGLAEEIWAWPHLLGTLALRLSDMLRPDADVDEDGFLAAFDSLNDATAELLRVALSWPSASPSMRDELLAVLVSTREKYHAISTESAVV